jgi:cytochrome c oxidase assembly protein subunit 15
MQTAPLTRRRDPFVILAWGVLVFTIIVIISGDVVQATESGAGCGETWPRCDGSLIPRISDLETGVEFTHRMVTVLLGVGYAALALGAWRRRGAGVTLRQAHRRGAPVWRAMFWAIVFFLVEVLLGAALVVFGWVENDASFGRVVADGVHLVNTFLMVGALTLVLFHARGGGRLTLDLSRATDRLALTGIAVLVLVGISGAINSLADALYFAEGVDVESTPIASILVAIRGIHPVVAIAGGIGVFLVAGVLAEGAASGPRRLARVVQGAVWVQFVIGFVNIALKTPLESQVIHLVIAHVLWAGFVYLSARLLATPATAPVADSVRP